MRFQRISALIFLFVVLFSGCSQNCPVRGTVVFDDDTPLETGIVVCSDGKAEYIGHIGAEGRYSLGVLKDGTGVPKGTYEVCIRGANAPTGRIVKLSGGGMEVDEPELYSVVEKKFADPKQSGLTVIVPSAEEGYVLKVGQRQPVPPPDRKARYVTATP